MTYPMHPLLKRTRFTRGNQGPLPPIAYCDWRALEIPDRWDWLAALPSWSFHIIGMSDYPVWDKVPTPARLPQLLEDVEPKLSWHPLIRRRQQEAIAGDARALAFEGLAATISAPPFVMLQVTRGQPIESDEMARRFDDEAEGLFYCRDWTSDGIPFANDGELYWSGFWFQLLRDAKRFQQQYGGAGSWEPDYEVRQHEMRQLRHAA